MALLTPRPMPDRRVPLAAGGLMVVLALPIFLIAGWRIEGWALGAVFWAGSQAFGYLLNLSGIGAPNLHGSGVVAFGMMTRGILLMIVAIVIAAVDPWLALAGALVYAFGFTVELALGLTLYFAAGPKR